MFKQIIAALAATAALSLAACEQEGPAEKAGERIDEAGERIGDAVDELRGEPDTLGENLKEAAEDACEQVDEATAANPDC